MLTIALFAPGPTELLLILFIALLIFGNKLPQTMRSLGASVNEFKRGLNDVSDAPPVMAAAPAPRQAPVAPVQVAPQAAESVNKQIP